MLIRPVIRCRVCKLNQFMTGNEKCRKCRADFFEKPVEVQAAQVLRNPELTSGDRLRIMLKLLRVSAGDTQRDIASRCNWNRTYVAKVEKGKAPTLRSIKKFAGALGITPYGLITMSEAIQ